MAMGRSLKAFAFKTYAATPRRMALCTNSTSLFWVRKMILQLGQSSWILFAASKPFMIGIPISRSAISGPYSTAFCTASSPLVASPTIRHSGLFCRIVRTTVRHWLKSSATRIRIWRAGGLIFFTCPTVYRNMTPRLLGAQTGISPIFAASHCQL